MTKEVPVMLDSTVLKQVPKLNSPIFKQLKKYSDIGVFKLYLSEVVEQEYLTWITEKVQQAYDDVVKATLSLDTYYEKPRMLFLLDFTAHMAYRQINEVLENIVNNWKTFKESANVTILPIESSHGCLVMSSYFRGDIPFKGIKNRSDIPDGFIYHSILDLLSTNDKVLFVSQDKKLVKKIGSDCIVCFESLSELFLSQEYRIQDDFFQKLKNDDRAIYLFKYFIDEIQRKAVYQIEFSDFIYSIEEEFGDDVVGEYLDVSSSVETVTFDEKNIKVISKHSYLLPFSADLIHLVNSKASKDDLLFFSEKRINNLEKEVNDDGEFKISESFKNTVQGNLSVIFEDSNPLLWEEKKSDKFWVESTIEEITVTIEDIKLNA